MLRNIARARAFIVASALNSPGRSVETDMPQEWPELGCRARRRQSVPAIEKNTANCQTCLKL